MKVKKLSPISITGAIFGLIAFMFFISSIYYRFDLGVNLSIIPATAGFVISITAFIAILTNRQNLRGYYLVFAGIALSIVPICFFVLFEISIYFRSQLIK